MDGANMDDVSQIEGLEPDLLDSSLPTPLYHQVYLILKDRIRNGRFARNAMLPGEQDLSQLFNVSRITVKRALNELAADGLISRHRGRGSLVTAAAIAPIVKGSFFSLIESLKQMGLETEVRLVEVSDIIAGETIGQLLDVSASSLVQRAIRLRSLNGEPFSYLLTYIPETIARRYTEQDLSKTPLLKLLEQVGAEVSEAEQWISAVSADPMIAAALDVQTGSPLLKIERIMRDKNGHPVQLVYAHYRSDRFQYHVKTSRRRGQTPSWKAQG
jgi:GntR family transcriptional regulator